MPPASVSLETAVKQLAGAPASLRSCNFWQKSDCKLITRMVFVGPPSLSIFLSPELPLQHLYKKSRREWEKVQEVPPDGNHSLFIINPPFYHILFLEVGYYILLLFKTDYPRESVPGGGHHYGWPKDFLPHI